jgi:hypothetical protein
MSERAYQDWSCGDETCPIRTPEGKRFERVIVWAQSSLATINHLISASRIQNVPAKNPMRGMALIAFIEAFEAAKAMPYNQAVHERLWVLGERAAGFLDDEEKVLLTPWIPPFSNTIPEMAFCRVADGWKYYAEKRTGFTYGDKSRAKLEPVHQTCDECVNALRNLLVHGSGFLEADEKGKRRLEKFSRLQTQTAAHSASKNPLLQLPARITALADGDVVMLNSSEVVEYIGGVTEMLVALESKTQ